MSGSNTTNTVVALSAAAAAAIAAVGAFALYSKPKPKPTLTYFNLRGLGELPRLLLAEAGVSYDDNRLSYPKAADFDSVAAKLPFGQVPLYEEGTFRLAQSSSISRYIARENGLAGADNQEAAVADSIVDAINSDLRPARFKFQEAAFSEDKKTELKDKYYKEMLPKFTAFFEKILRENNGGTGFIVGKNITWADIALYHYYDMTVKEAPECLNDAPLLKGLIGRVGTRPRIAKWVSERPVTPF